MNFVWNQVLVNQEKVRNTLIIEWAVSILPYESVIHLS